MDSERPYTCSDYRQEMILLSLRQRLRQKGLPESEKETVRSRIDQLETEMRMK
jgi:hypothetical protein